MAEFDEFDALVERFNVEYGVIDALPETRFASAFAKRHSNVWLANYTASGTDHGSCNEKERPRTVRLDRTQTLDGMVARFRDGLAALPGAARQLGGRVDGGMGEYYRELQAPQRTLDQDAHGNWVARWLEHGKPDHFAHAEAYCYAADMIVARRPVWRLRPVLDTEPSPAREDPPGLIR